MATVDRHWAKGRPEAQVGCLVGLQEWGHHVGRDVVAAN